MIKLAVSTRTQAMHYAERTRLEYDEFLTETGGMIQTYNDDGSVCQQINYYIQPTKRPIAEVQVFEIFNPFMNRYEEYNSMWNMMQDFDLDSMHIPYMTRRITFSDGSQEVYRTMLDSLSFSSELVNFVSA
jgi:hypothetical protein